MATKKHSKGSRAAARRAKTTARPRATAKATKTVAKAKTKPVAKKTKPVAKAKPVAAKRPAAKPAAVKAPPVESKEVAALKTKFQRERSGLERRLTEAVREIGVLRHHELRAMQLERQLAERDATIGRLQLQLTELERRPTETIYIREVQQSLALGEPVNDLAVSQTDLDEFEDDRLADDADLVSDDE